MAQVTSRPPGTTTADQEISNRESIVDDDVSFHATHRPTQSNEQGESKRALKRPRNAFTELMQSKPTTSSTTTTQKSPRKAFNKSKRLQSSSIMNNGQPLHYWQKHENKHGVLASPPPPHPQHGLWRGRSALEQYLVAPEFFPKDRVIWYDKDWVIINDLYPKSTVHLLLMPRNRHVSRLHAFQAFNDKEFLKATLVQVDRAKNLAASELRRLFGDRSVTERARLAAMESDEDSPLSDKDLPPGRDWLSEIRAGIHVLPSMSNLHIHIISPDMCGRSLKSTHHYNTFNTPFFVQMGEFGDGTEEKPGLAEAEKVERYANGKKTTGNMICWKCDRGYGTRWERMEMHLKVELDNWVTE